MKFIREIISGRSLAGGRMRPEADAIDELPPRAAALDLQSYSVPSEPQAAPVPPADPEAAREDAPAGPGSWARSDSGRVLSRDLADAIREPEAADPAGVGAEHHEDDPGADPAEMLESAPVEHEPDAEPLDDDGAWDQIDAMLAEAEAGNENQAAEEPDADTAEEPEIGQAEDEITTGGPGGADDQGETALSVFDAEKVDAADTDAAGRWSFVRDDEPALDMPPFRRRSREITAPSPARSEAEVTQLRERRDDPFQRLERMSREAPAQDSPSPFERLRERRAEPRDGVPAPASARPRTRLSDEWMEQMAAEKPAAESPIEVPAPAVGRAGRRAGRVKTRLLGFGGGDEINPFETAGDTTQAAGTPKFPVGWLAVVAGPGRGNAFTLLAGVSQIGRGEGQAVRLDFGDNSISRQNHAAIAYDRQQKKFYLGHGGKANLVRLNGRPVLSTEDLETGSHINIGETTLQFVALCGASFDWDRNQDEDIDTAVFG